MGRFAVALGAASLLASIAPAFAAPEPGTIGFSFEKKRTASEDAPNKLRRRQTIAAGLDNEILLYFINCTVGTPPQSFSLQLDTGSSDIWFPAVNADICQQDAQNCPFGTYDASASSSYKDPGLPEFQIQYVDGTQISGAYLSDVLNVGGTQLTNMTMAAALTANTRGIGIMGIGFQSGESSVFTSGFTYPNIINVMKNEGKINSLAYSLWLDDLASNTGVILFGGVDTNKYHGDLVSLPIQIDTQSGTISSFTVAWTGLTVQGSGVSSDFSPKQAQPAILDSGTTDTLLPDDIANSIFNGVGVLTDPSFGNVVRCSLANDDLTFSFTFGGKGGAVVNVSLSEFVTPLLTSDGSQPTFSNGDAACSFAIEAAGDNPILFGDSFLRSAYVVYDLENQQIGLAQTNFDSSKGDAKVQVIQASSDIPNVASTASAASVAQSFTGLPRVSESATGSGSLGGGTSRSATFNLTPSTATATSGSSGSSGGSKGNAASSSFRAGSMEKTTILAAGVVLVGIVFGGGLMLF